MHNCIKISHLDTWPKEKWQPLHIMGVGNRGARGAEAPPPILLLT